MVAIGVSAWLVLGVGIYALRPVAERADAPAARTVPLADPAFAFAPLEEPRALPALQFQDGDGRIVALTDFRGRVVLLNIWATWCVPCRREMPTLDRLQASLGGPDFEVVALSVDRGGPPAVKAYFEETKLAALRIYVDRSGEAVEQLNVLGLPTTILVDRNGSEIGRTVGPAEWDSPEIIRLIRRYMAKPSADLSSMDAEKTWRAICRFGAACG